MSQLERLQQQQAALDAATKDVRALVDAIVDKQSFVESLAFLTGKDRLDGDPLYGEGVLCGTATVEGIPLVVIAQNSAVLYGSFGAATADKICRALTYAKDNDLPILSILDSSGARILDGVAVLEGYGSVLRLVSRLRDSGYPHLAYVKGQAVGMMAVYASMCGFRLASPRSVLCVNAPKVLAATQSRDRCTATAILEDGGVDFLCEDEAAVQATVRSLLCWLHGSLNTDDDPNRESALLPVDLGADALFAAVLDEDAFLEYRAGSGNGLRCAFGFLNGTAVGLACSSGTLGVDALTKLADFASCLTLVGAPLVSLVDCSGIQDEDQLALARAMARCVDVLDGVAKIAVTVGNAYGSAYTLLASKGLGYTYTLAFPDACIAPLPPAGGAQLVYRDRLHEAGNSEEQRRRLQEMYAARQGDAFAAAAVGYVDQVIEPATLRPYLANALNMLG